MRREHSAGFTLMELLITLAVGGILLAIAVPNMRDFVRNGRLTSAANDLLHSLQLARTEAIKRQANVVVCGTANPNAPDAALTCSYNSIAGWFVFQDDGDWAHGGAEPVLERHSLVDSSVNITADRSYIESYAPTGFANAAGPAGILPTRNIVICDVRGNVASGASTVGTTSTGRALLIQPTGRARVSNTVADVSAAKTAIGGGCP